VREPREFRPALVKVQVPEKTRSVRRHGQRSKVAWKAVQQTVNSGRCFMLDVVGRPKARARSPSTCQDFHCSWFFARSRAASRPSRARFTIRCLSSSAIALSRAISPRPSGVVRSKCGLSRTFTKQPRARVDALDDGYAVEHRPRGAVPFGDDEHVTGAELIDSLLELRTALGILAAGASPARS
jgi:hypothetical protein